MTRKGRAGAALAVAAVGSFVAGSVGVVGIVLAASWLADQALRFGPPEYFALAVTGLLLLSRLSGGSVIHAFVMVAIGLALGTVGMEPISAVRRFTFGSTQLSQGVELVPVIMGLYGVAEVMLIAESGLRKAPHRHRAPPRAAATRDGVAAVGVADRPRLRGRASSPGLVPGPASVLATFISYALERKVSKTPERFGQGAIEGVAGPGGRQQRRHRRRHGAAPLAGHPVLAATAILLGALVITGIQPGPLLISQRPEVFWGVVASMYVGNVILLVLNLPLVGLFVSVLRLPQHVLATLVLLLCLVGAYSLNNSQLDLWVLVVVRHLRLWAAQARHRPLAARRRARAGPASWRRRCGRPCSWSAAMFWRSWDARSR